MLQYNHLVILCIILFFGFLIHSYYGPSIENLENQHYIESNNLVNSSCHSFYDRQYVMDNETRDFTKNELSVNIHSRTKKYCVPPGIYNDCSDTCDCPEGYLYDPTAGCVTPDYYYPTTTPPPPPPTNTPPPMKNCPAGYVYDPYVNACLGVCLLHEYYDPATGNCIKDCSYVWSDWTKCDTTTGTKTRDPTIIYKANTLGKQCPVREISNCVLDCSYVLSDWATCDIGTGTTTRTPGIFHKNTNGGATCPPKLETKKCDIDCSYSWSKWTECDMYSGTQSSDYTLIHDSWNQGKVCPDSAQKTRKCAIDCAYNLINEKCNADDGYYYYNVDMTRDAQNTNCYYDGLNGKQTVSRNQLVKSKKQCNVPCDIDLISPYCNSKDGLIYYVVDVTSNPTNAKCYYNHVEVKDNDVVKSAEKCAVDCSYTLVNPKCVSGTVHKTVNMKTNAMNTDCLAYGVAVKNGSVVDTTEECDMPTPSCSTSPTAKSAAAPAATSAAKPIDCAGSWGGWGDCKKANGCKRERHYIVATPASNGGQGCSVRDGEVQQDRSNCQGGSDLCWSL